LDFLGAPLFRSKTGLESVDSGLGFPWILSCESGLINGLRGIFAQKFFARLFPGVEWREDGRRTVEAKRSGKIVHEMERNSISAFPQSIVEIEHCLRLSAKVGRSMRRRAAFL